MSQETADDLREALALIEDERHWTTGQFEQSTEAGVAYCSAGAVAHVTVNSERRRRAIDALVEVMRGRNCPADLGLIHYNDSATHADVVSLFKDAIIAEEARP